MRRPVRPVGAKGSRNRAGLTAANCLSVRRIVGNINVEVGV